MIVVVGSKSFIDSNVLLYLLSGDQAKADRAEDVMTQGGVVSVQVLNEVASVAVRNFRMSIAEVREAVGLIRAVCSVETLTERTHEIGLQVADRYGYAIHDSMLISAALVSGCDVFLTEDLQHGQVIDRRLKIRNPFRDKIH